MAALTRGSRPWTSPHQPRHRHRRRRWWRTGGAWAWPWRPPAWAEGASPWAGGAASPWASPTSRAACLSRGGGGGRDASLPCPCPCPSAKPPCRHPRASSSSRHQIPWPPAPRDPHRLASSCASWGGRTPSPQRRRRPFGRRACPLAGARRGGGGGHDGPCPCPPCRPLAQTAGSWGSDPRPWAPPPACRCCCSCCCCCCCRCRPSPCPARPARASSSGRASSSCPRLGPPGTLPSASGLPPPHPGPPWPSPPRRPAWRPGTRAPCPSPAPRTSSAPSWRCTSPCTRPATAGLPGSSTATRGPPCGCPQRPLRPRVSRRGRSPAAPPQPG